MNGSNFQHFIKKCGNLKHAQQLHAQAIFQALHPYHQPLTCQILNAYARIGRTTDAYKVFDQILKPDIVSLTSLISLHLQCNQPHKAVSVFSNIISSGIQPDGFAVVGALSASTRLCHLELGREVHALIYRHKLDSESVVSNALIDMYSKTGRIRSAESVFAGMITRDAVSWSSMLNGYAKCSDLGSAVKLFDEMLSRDTVSWTVMITAHVQQKQPITALKLFREMNLEGHQPTSITIVGVLSACADVGALDLGRTIHGYVFKLDTSFDVTLYNALIDMYSKSGNLKMAEYIFNGITNKDVYTWTSMISGFAVHGGAKRAIEVFSDMLNSGISPNKITFLAILLACSHGGLVDEGRKMFDDMRTVYNYKPQVEHFGCMIDLLGRAGLLREAELLIQDMGMDVDCVIWRSILSASLIHGNVELAELAGKKIREREPDDDGVYVLLWNMYASSNRWKEALEMRRKMKEMKLLKRPGCSWIEVDGIVREFLVDDKMNICEGEIDLVLEEMSRHLRTCSSVLYSEEDA
ncbi:pentatricopeptide repeat-containing protein At2g22410, mitochondrial [Dendrobium catenatum]|uniref:Pentatricopeptide repeat-containing protein n=1 Tax=Dendrobium catenatum TaxID=906689 RepID=A0A2I0WET6_9ASPA|nr:pentatricopeptide repeat-containing protein At2g22410, mitochondrial [Dendrobium catenatum]PKU74167.1 Pentatricopeptide repeat-containing protein [Dendrobium catenatum]